MHRFGARTADCLSLRAAKVVTTIALIAVLIPATSAPASIAQARDAGQSIANSPTGVVPAIALGSGHTCALDTTGQITCWGFNGDGQLGNGTTDNQTTPPAPITLPAGTTATAITAGTSHTCALLNTGQISCWGEDGAGQLGNGAEGNQTTPPAPITLPAGTTATAITAGSNHTCALLNTGNITCWGFDNSGQLGNGTDGNQQSPPTPVTLPANTTATAITAGNNHTCALLNTGNITCWGDDNSGQLGNGTDGNQQSPPTPITLPANTTATAITAGNNHTCALLNTGNITCWGRDNDGQLGNGTGNSSQQSPPPPITLPTGATATAITAGSSHTCALLNTAQITCWGFSGSGRLGNGTAGDQQSPPTPITLPAGTTATAITAGSSYTCALLNTGQAACWGTGGSGRLGTGNATTRLTPVLTSPLPSVDPTRRTTTIATGGGHTCALLATGEVTCWGEDLGQLGSGTAGNQTTPPEPITLPAGTTATAITAGSSNHTCALLNTGNITCWGDDSSGQLGNGSGIGGQQTPPTPVTLPAGATATAITAGSRHTCTLLNTGQVTCWGNDSFGQLGNGTNGAQQSPPAPITLPAGTTATAITTGYTHNCALLNTGQVTCWGNDQDGQLGNGSGSGSQQTPPTPITLPAGTTATAVSGGFGHTCALLNTGNITCWGDDSSGQLGNGSGIGDQQSPPAPITLPANATATAIAAGVNHTCALLNTGQVTCWGGDNIGQLGNGAAGNHQTPPAPITLPGGATATAISTDAYHTCALLNTGDIACWGNGRSGQLGNGTTRNAQHTPTLVTFPTATPTLALATGQTDPTNNTTINVAATFDQPVTLTTTDITVGGTAGATTATPTGTGTTWNIAITGTTSDGTVTVSIPQGTLGAYGNAASNTLAINYDTTVPTGGPTAPNPKATVSLAPGQSVDTSTTPIMFSIVFDQPVTGLTADDLNIGGTAGATSATITGSGAAYTVTVSAPSTAGTVTLMVSAGAGANTNGQSNTASNTATVTFTPRQAEPPDQDPPTADPPQVDPPTTPDAFVSLTPKRYLDTRDNGKTFDGLFEKTGKRDRGTEYRIRLGGRGGVPSNAAAAVITLTAIDPEAIGFLTAHPCVSPRPNASSLNYTSAVNVGNEIVAPLTTAGELCLFTKSATHLTVDVTGFVAHSAPTVTFTPARFLDTRTNGHTVDGQSQRGGIPGADNTTTLQIAGRNTIPIDAVAVIVNVTAIRPATNGYVTVHPCLPTTPMTSSLNHVTGVNRANEIIATLDDQGRICLVTSADTHLAADVVGYFPAGTNLVPVGPSRLLDTRPTGTTIDGADQGDGIRPSRSEYVLQVAGRPGVPANATTAVVNVTAVRPTDRGYITIHPCLEPPPNASSLNFTKDVNGASEIITQLDNNGRICIYTHTTSHITVDVVATTSPT